ncbi:MAG: hypothetical protein COZ06_19590 [Armatimonadetes bacterium CG_4_10_14_3_um_filter_66_18]|nr:hypothetical protein [Armatimonadota bacterium]OIO95252.1 MAG: hypothetical protein AUJ96_27130 [Armatimonadetes bacterium CG2_30_66_41]PIU89126.1 MAG: hypothetical protein COS65_29045 [Armatimonadetes bacterium CG06_land_8_20_14_3_00_66_21]PIX42756.1 MAG: hypothetical protein COZ57_20700 [Armatimonadetes bacterium CG_4_8_14_3_um_filter_66_20]PIY44869.1 MAG: hypothetical protein COZ06_19590 [Armatimonadetes bacterium CG_4_10_14_3_um_filter_66_18]PIZ41646.1 MAG: hypothetical protein COY42_18
MRLNLSVRLAVLCAIVPVAARSAELWRDDFRAPKTYERWGPRCWTATEGERRFSTAQGPAWLIPRLDESVQATARTRVRVAKRLADGYVWAGVILLATEDNFWELMLVESPGGKRYFELIERLNGLHQAQIADGQLGTRLAGETSGALATWEHGSEYELELSLTPEAIVGTVTDPKTGSFWRRSYVLAGGRAVKRGRLGMTVTGLAGAFGAFTVEGALAPEEAKWDVPSGRAGTVAIIADETGALAGQWAEILTREGYGVLTVSWAELLRGPLPRVDLLVLADARRLPIEAREAVKREMRSAGKVLALGAPAFTEVLAHTATGWVTAENYSESLLGQLKPTPLKLSGQWQRGAQFVTKRSTIEPTPGEGEGAWKLSFDYEGWDGFRTEVAGAFPDDRGVLTFWARGDENTSQMLVECGEKDGSRWIATVPLTTSWRPIVLRAQDFPFWKDSPANRGQPGDHLHPANLASLTLGLAGSHTKKVLAGPHTLWVRQLATAPDPGDDELDFSVPEIEAVSPSYKLFPLKSPLRLTPSPEQAVLGPDAALTYTGAAYSPVWRVRGRGWGREPAARWVPLLEARDDKGQHRGALLSLVLGAAANPDAMWASAGVAAPETALSDPKLRSAVVATAKAMTAGCFLLEGGAPYFSCAPGETMTFGAEALNAGRAPRELSLGGEITPANQRAGARQTLPAKTQTIAPGSRATVTWSERAPQTPGTYTVTVTLREGDRALDRITHELTVAAPRKPSDDDFVRVQGSQFRLHGKSWYFKGINYYPTSTAGRPLGALTSREVYDPEIPERDLSWMQSVGINAISAVYALQPPDPAAAGAFRDQLDFLDRCERHGIKVFLFMPNARPFAGANVAWVKDYLAKAGIKDHPAIMTWELSWEPIHGSWGVPSGLEFMQDPWNAWVAQRYGSLDNAVTDWGFRPELTKDGKLPVPTQEMTLKHGAWDPLVAAFRRAWSDVFSQAYREIVSDLRSYDPRHLISFRFGACSIPGGQAFAHAHSVGVLKHVDFMNPEGYSLRKGWGLPTPAEDLRRGGVITLYFRHFSGEKPVVWMEFGYTVNGIHEPWTPGRLHVKPEELANQVAEYEALYAMFIESGARGAAPWWLPGGFRLGENSDFGVLEPEGSERPVCQVIRKYLPQFDTVRHDPQTAHIEMDLDAHYADAWQTYSDEYLKLVKAGQRPDVRTAGTGTDSANCPLTAVGNRPYSGTNPPIYLNAEFNALEIRCGSGPWRSVKEGETVTVTEGQPVFCRASAGNLAEAKWLASPDGQPGGVYLAGRKAYGLEFAAPIERDTPFLKDAAVKEFVLLPQARGEVNVSFEMSAKGRAYFGERRTVRLVAAQ